MATAGASPSSPVTMPAISSRARVDGEMAAGGTGEVVHGDRAAVRQPRVQQPRVVLKLVGGVRAGAPGLPGHGLQQPVSPSESRQERERCLVRAPEGQHRAAVSQPPTVVGCELHAARTQARHGENILQRELPALDDRRFGNGKALATCDGVERGGKRPSAAGSSCTPATTQVGQAFPRFPFVALALEGSLGLEIGRVHDQ